MMDSNFFPFERNRYFYGKMLTTRDFETEQKYMNDKRRLLNRCVLGAGIVCGLGVNVNDDMSLTIESGLALDYTGREIAVPAPVFQKLAMLPGSDKLEGHETAYLCLAYKEAETEPVSNIGASGGGEECNKIEEGFSLFLDTEQPDYNTLYGEGGLNMVTVAYETPDIAIVQIMPVLAVAGEELSVKYVIVKNLALPPLSFTMEFRSDYIRSSDGAENLRFSYSENPDSLKHVTTVEFAVRAAQMPGVKAPYATQKPAMTVECGELSSRSELHQVGDIMICKDDEEYYQTRLLKLSKLGSRLYGEHTPIYLAKIDFAMAGSIYMLRNVTAHPFSQRLSFAEAGAAAPALAPAQRPGGESFNAPDVKTEVETLKYWQKPEVFSEYRNGRLFFRFGIPSSEAYDYATSSGVAEIPLSGTIRVNARFVSDEIPHLLGLGNVSITLSADYGSGENRRLLFGNGEVFGGKDVDKKLPKIQTAAILDPNKGTFRIGVWCHDHVDGQSIRIHWFAMKTTRDTAQARSADKVSVAITPEIHKVKVRGTVQFKAAVSGSSDTGVKWKLAEKSAGTINQNGTYKASNTPGTYEITATASADPEATASAFVIVGE